MFEVVPVKIRRLAVLGGGPSGLYAARLLKLRRPALEVTVHERNDPSETFGFGIALTGATQRNLAAADPDSCAAIRRAGLPLTAQELRLPGGSVTIAGGETVGVGRAALLRVLLEHADTAGAKLEIGHREPGEIDADLILACDGANSTVRAGLAGELGAQVSVGRELYLWCGTDFALPHNTFIPVTTEHGTFVAHAYPYAADRSTVLVETSEATWRAAGFDVTTAALDGDRSGASDEASLASLEAAFADHLGGHRLLGNRTRWLRFSTVSCRHWHHGRSVLLGDAAHTAHYSLGSGTKLAMEDAIALSASLLESDDVEAGLCVYEAARRPSVARIQRLARRSQLWWESFPSRRGLPGAQTALAYMTRAGNVTLEQLRATNPDLVAAALCDFSADGDGDVDLDGAGGGLAGWALDRPLARNGRCFATRVLPDRAPADDLVVATMPADVPDAWGPEATKFVESVRTVQAGGADGVRLTGRSDREAVLDRLALGERIRLETGVLTVVEGPEELQDDLAAGLASGRVDLVAYEAARHAVPTPGSRHRVGLIVPSSNVTVETELPALLSRHASARFSFHASRMRMTAVTPSELAAMNAQAARCVDELADAGVDALLYGCLVAVMAEGPRSPSSPAEDAAHRRVEAAVSAQLAGRGVPLSAASSAGALLEALDVLGASTVALVTPYMRPLAEQVVAYLEAEDVKVADWRALEVADNAAVGRIPGEQVMAAADSLDLAGVDAVIISACVQMPSLDLVQAAEDRLGLPVLSAATAGAYVLLRRLGLPPVLPGAGSLLAGDLAARPARPVLQEA